MDSQTEPFEPQGKLVEGQPESFIASKVNLSGAEG